jgi:hypothetical protein
MDGGRAGDAHVATDAARDLDAGRAGDAHSSPDAGEPSSHDAAVRRCDDEAAADVVPAWERITTGLDDFVYGNESFHARGLAGVAYGHGEWLVVGGGYGGDDVIRYATSSDGVHWEASSISSKNGKIGAVSRVLYAQDQFVFAVMYDMPTTTPSVLYTSADGHDWDDHPLPGVDFVLDLASDGERTVLANGNLWSSTDFEHWTEVTFPTDNPKAGIISLAFGDGRWVAAGENSSVVNGTLREESIGHGSTDGIEWTDIDLPGMTHFNVTYGAGVWLATNILGEHRASRDGRTFEEVTPAGAWSSGASEPDYRVRHAGKHFVSTAADSSNVFSDPPRAPTEVRVVSSRDGVDWQEFGSVPGLPLPDGAYTIEYDVQDVAYANCRYVAAGTYSVLVPGALDPPPFSSEIGPFLITADVSAP